MKVCVYVCACVCMHTLLIYWIISTDLFPQGGNDYEIFVDSRTIGHTVVSPDNTLQLLKELFD